jgi:hypothetical protein
VCVIWYVLVCVCACVSAVSVFLFCDLFPLPDNFVTIFFVRYYLLLVISHYFLHLPHALTLLSDTQNHSLFLSHPHPHPHPPGGFHQRRASAGARARSDWRRGRCRRRRTRRLVCLVSFLLLFLIFILIVIKFKCNARLISRADSIRFGRVFFCRSQQKHISADQSFVSLLSV